MNGWIKLPRSIINHWLWQDAERFKWWCDLLMLAAWEDKKTMHDAHLFVLEKGQMIASVSFLAERWEKSAPTIIKYLKLLEDEGMIKRSVLYRQTSIITICKYESYTEQENTTLYTQIDNQINTIVDGIVYTNKENKEYKESKEEKNNTLSCVKKPKEVAEKNIVPPTLDMVRARCMAMHYTFDPEAFHAYYETRGWMLNNRKKMKDWWAACVTWQKNEQERKQQKTNQYGNNNEDHPTNSELIRNTYDIITELRQLDEQGVPAFRDF